MSEFFSYFPEDNDYEEHETLEAAIESADKSLEWYKEGAFEGWSEAVGGVHYGKILGRASESLRKDRDDYTPEEWGDMGYSDEWDTILDYELSKPGPDEDLIIKYFLTGNVGLSSKALIGQYLLKSDNKNYNHPHDCGDLDRCIEAFKVMNIPNIDHMKVLSSEWHEISKNWKGLLRDSEIDRSECYRLLRRCIDK